MTGPAGSAAASVSASGCVTGAVLAGGRSSRLGFDKARLRLGTGRELIDDLIRKLRRVTDDVVIAGGDPAVHGRRDARLLPDRWPGAGPLGGIATALEGARCDWALVVACDLPFLRTAIVRLLVEARSDEVDAIVPRIGGYPEPTHAVYSRRCLPVIRESLENGQLKIAGFFASVRVRWVDEDELRRVDAELISFSNVNTPDEVRAAHARAVLTGPHLLTE